MTKIVTYTARKRPKDFSLPAGYQYRSKDDRTLAFMITEPLTTQPGIDPDTVFAYRRNGELAYVVFEITAYSVDRIHVAAKCLCGRINNLFHWDGSYWRDVRAPEVNNTGFTCPSCNKTHYGQPIIKARKTSKNK